MSDQDSLPMKCAKSVVNFFFVTFICVMVWNILFAPLRWALGLRRIDYDIRVFPFIGLALLVGFYIPVLSIVATLTSDKIDPKILPVVFGLFPIFLVAFFFFIKWETHHYYQQIIDYQEAVANQEVEAIQERRQAAMDKLAFFGITRESLAAEEAVYKQQHPEPETDEERLFRWRREAVIRQKQLGLL